MWLKNEANHFSTQITDKVIKGFFKSFLYFKIHGFVVCEFLGKINEFITISYSSMINV